MEANAPTVAEYRDALRKLRILVVGGGAIGQVFAYQLSQGKAEVALFVRPEYEEAAREGFDLHRYGLAGVRPRQHLKVFDVYTDPRRLRSLAFDQVWLCVSSPALRSGLIDDLGSSVRDAIWVSFQPGLEDREFLVQRVPANKLVTGLVNFVAYQAPLPGEDLWPPGIAYFVPPMTMTQFSGPEPYASAVANLLQSVGFTAGVHPDAAVTSRFGSAVLLPFVVALEAAGWSWSRLASNAALITLLTESVRDLHVALTKATGKAPGSFALAQKPWAWKMALFAAPKLASFPLEAYFAYHFTKVRVQSDQMVDDFVQLCRDNALISRPFEALRDQWRTRRPKVEAAEQIPAARVQASTPPPRALSASALPLSEVPTDETPHLVPVLPAPAVPESEVATDEVPHLVPVLPAPVVAPIEVDFDFGGGVDDDELLGGMPFDGGESPLALEEPTSAPSEDEDEPVQPTVVIGDPAASSRPVEEPSFEVPSEPVEIAAELELLPELKKGPAPVLRTRADLEAVVGPEPEKPASLLPFDETPDEEEEMLSSVPVDAEPLPPLPATAPLSPPPGVKPPAPAETSGEVHFRAAVPEPEREELRRQDFIQTQLANEENDPSLRELKAKLRSRLGGTIKPPGSEK